MALGLTGRFNNSTGEFSVIAVVPEPSRALLLGFGLAGVLLRRRRASKELQNESALIQGAADRQMPAS
jgi:hypothetical protein